jgi:hypothetical protein
MAPTGIHHPIDTKGTSPDARRRHSLARLAARIRAEGGSEAELGVAILATSDRFALGDLWRSLCGGAS